MRIHPRASVVVTCLTIALIGCAGPATSGSTSPAGVVSDPGEPTSSSPVPGPSDSTSPDAVPGASADASPSSSPRNPPSAVAIEEREPPLVAEGPETAFDWFPWLPEADPGVVPSLRIDSFVRPNVHVPVSEAPGAPPYRYDTGDADPSTHPPMVLPKGGLFVVLRGPVLVDGVEWYLFAPAQLSVDIPTGWSPIADAAGTRFISPATVACPDSPMKVATLWELTLTDGLPACYGATVITLVGSLECTDGPDEWVAGPDWVESGACRFSEGAPTVYGLDPDLPAGRYAVRGSFLHPEAADCRSRDGQDSSIDRLTAVLQCRRGFVALGADPA